MPRNTKWRLQVRRRDDAAKRRRVPAANVTPLPAPKSSWWTTAPRDGFTKQAETQRTSIEVPLKYRVAAD